MKQKLLLKTMLLLCALIAGSSSVWADTYTLGWGSASGSEGTFTNFTDVSGTVTDLVSFSTAKNDGTTAPAYNSSNNDLRLYYDSNGKGNGGSITLTPAAGVTITDVVLTSSTGPSVKYKVGTGSATSVASSGSGPYTYTISSISSTPSSVLQIQNVNTTHTQLRIKTIKITYTKVDVAKHTASFSVNGAIASSADFAEGADIEFPAVSSVCGMKFMGWTTSAIVGTQNSAPATLLTEATMSTSDITYYAVFAYYDAGRFVLDYSKETTLASASWSYGNSYTHTATDGSVWIVKASKNSGMQLNSGKNCSIKIPTCPSDIKSINITTNSSNKAVGLSASDYTGSGTITYIVYGSDNSSQTLDLSSKTVKTGYIVPKGGVTVITKIEVIYYNTSITKDYCTTVPTATITLNAACTDGEKIYGTYSNNSAFIVPAELTVSEVGVSAGKLVVTDYLTGSVVPAGTGVLVSAATAGEKIVALTSATGAAAGAGNLLHGTGDADITASDMETAAPSCKYYRLTMHNGTDIGFWWGAASGAAFDLAANKAYLAVPTGAGAPSMLWFDNESTGVDEVKGKMEEVRGDFFDLQGRKVANPTKGLYIVNGKKVVIK